MLNSANFIGFINVIVHVFAPFRATAAMTAVILMAVSTTAFSANIPTPNLDRNIDIAGYYKNALKSEQVTLLNSQSEQFYALWLEQYTSTPQGGLLILHDSGHTPDWPYLLKQVRTYLPVVGWSTLSVDLPTPQADAIGQLAPAEGSDSAPNVTDSPTTSTADLDAESTSNEDWQKRVMERIATAIKELNSKGLFNIAIIGYGDGAYWGTRYLAERITEEEENGYALLMFDAPLFYNDFTSHIAALKIPILDLYMQDSDFAHYQAQQRKAAAMRNDSPDYLQIHDALRQNAYGKQKIDRSTRRVWGWLKQHAAGQEANVVGLGPIN